MNVPHRVLAERGVVGATGGEIAHGRAPGHRGRSEEDIRTMDGILTTRCDDIVGFKDLDPRVAAAAEG